VREECDIDDGDGTGGLANAKDRESLDLNVETATHGASGDSRDGKAGTRRGTAGTGEPQHVQQHCRAAVDGENDEDEVDQHQGEGDGSQEAGERRDGELPDEEDHRGDPGGGREGQDV